MAATYSAKPKNVSSVLDEREAAIPTEEEKCVGRVELDVVSTYWKAVGLFIAPAILAALLMMQSTRNISDWWLAHWVSEVQNETSTWRRGFVQSSSNSSYDPTFYLAVYGGIAITNTCFTFLRAFLFAYGGLNAAKYLHKRLVDVILQVLNITANNSE